MEISQLRSGWLWWTSRIRAEGTMDGVNVPPSFQDGNLFGAFPDTPCLANFRLSLPGRLLANAGLPGRKKAPESWRSPRRSALLEAHEPRASVLECGGPPPLFIY